MMPRIWRLALPGLLFLAAPLEAQQGSKVDVHGFGTWAYGRTGSVNSYLFGDHYGAYDNVDFALNVGVAASERLRVNAQITAAHEGSPGEEGARESTVTELDFMYAEWRLSDRLHLRVGDVKQPFGIYTEIYDLGTVRPFIALPQSVYGGAGFAGESYKGVGLTGDLLAGAWRLSYDVYGGGLSIAESAAPIDYLLEGAEAVQGEEAERTNEVIGGRLVIRPPVEGLSFGASAYSGAPAGEAEAPRRSVYGGQLEYLAGPLTLRSELAYESTKEFVTTQMKILGGYVEAGYRLGDHWQVAGLYDRQYTTLDPADISPAPSLLQHTSLGGGLNYWISSNLVLKGSYQSVRGNRFAAPGPEELAAVVESHGLDRRTGLFTVGAQLSF